MLNTPGLEVAEGNQVLQAVNWYVDKNVGYADAQNAAWLLANGLDTVYTFDRRHFARLEGLAVRAPGEGEA